MKKLAVSEVRTAWQKYLSVSITAPLRKSSWGLRMEGRGLCLLSTSLGPSHSFGSIDGFSSPVFPETYFYFLPIQRLPHSAYLYLFFSSGSLHSMSFFPVLFLPIFPMVPQLDSPSSLPSPVLLSPSHLIAGGMGKGQPFLDEPFWQPSLKRPLWQCCCLSWLSTGSMTHQNGPIQPQGLERRVKEVRYLSTLLQTGDMSPAPDSHKAKSLLLISRDF